MVCDAIWDYLGLQADKLSLRDVQELASWTYPPSTESDRRLNDQLVEEFRLRLQLKMRQQWRDSRFRVFRDLGYLPEPFSILLRRGNLGSR